MITRKVEELRRRFDDHQKRQNIINLSDVYYAFANEYARSI